MPKVTLPDGKVLVGPAADAYLAAQKKAEKEAKKALEKKKVDALKSGDADAAWAAKADLASVKASAAMSTADAAQADVLAEISSGSSDYHFYHVMDADWDSDSESVNNYLQHNLGFGDNIMGLSKDAPGPKEINLFIGVRALTDEKIKEMYDSQKRDKSLAWFTDYLREPKVFEAHPSLLKKNGKMAVDVPEGGLVAVKTVRNVAQRKAYMSGAGPGMMLKIGDVTIHHQYICAVIPKEMEKSCYA